jgi:hypothetical protein
MEPRVCYALPCRLFCGRGAAHPLLEIRKGPLCSTKRNGLMRETVLTVVRVRDKMDVRPRPRSPCSSSRYRLLALVCRSLLAQGPGPLSQRGPAAGLRRAGVPLVVLDDSGAERSPRRSAQRPGRGGPGGALSLVVLAQGGGGASRAEGPWAFGAHPGTWPDYALEAMWRCIQARKGFGPAGGLTARVGTPARGGATRA